MNPANSPRSTTSLRKKRKWQALTDQLRFPRCLWKTPIRWNEALNLMQLPCHQAPSLDLMRMWSARTACQQALAELLQHTPSIQDHHVLLTKSMEALLAKSAKLRDIHGKVDTFADARPPQHHVCNCMLYKLYDVYSPLDLPVCNLRELKMSATNSDIAESNIKFETETSPVESHCGKVLVNGKCILSRLRFAKHKLALDIPISWVRLENDDTYPVLGVRDSIEYLVRSDNLPKLVGEQPMQDVQPILLEFWRRYSLQWPDYGVYNAAALGKVSLSRTIPVYLHGDEGRGFKRNGVMILALQGAIGRGSKPFLRKHPIQTVRKLKMGVNLQGSSFNSRLLYVAMPKKHYKNNPESWK